ncbi:MAG: NAD(P)/FAD-dependent oxidoreductase [Hadesarchaea archaeon]|nr:NAD(P)/FAD-dependent oxidoreductase [Hadesarchaea archaeon]
MVEDVIIIGGGPAGLFAALELSQNSDLSIKIVEKGKKIKNRHCPVSDTEKCVECEPCDVMCGIGGAGGMSDGTLNLKYDVGGDLTNFTESKKKAENLVEKVDSTLRKHGAPDETYGEKTPESTELARKAAAEDIKFIQIKQRHIGSEFLPNVIDSIREYLESRGVKFQLNTEVESIREDGVIINGEKKCPKFILAAPGRSGALWLAKQAKELGLGITHGAIDIGVRVEVPSVVMETVVEVSRDPKFHIQTQSYDDFVRTFCTNHQGFVVEERYGDYSGVNGHALRTVESKNTNFAFLSHIELTQPVTNTAAYGESIGRLATTIGGGRPVVQRLGDLRDGHRSTWDRVNRGHINPTLKSVTPGDISMALPGRIVTNIKEGLDQLDKVIPGVASDSTLLYAPEVKLYATQITVKNNMETEANNLFVAGDGAGLSRDIINAAGTGILAARGIMNKTN